MYHIIFEVAALPTRPNAQSKTSYWPYQEEKKRWLQWVNYATGLNKPDSPLTKAIVKMTRCSSKEPDCDGLYASCKPVLDALTRNRIILDDRPSIIEFSAYWQKAPPKLGKMIIEVIELSE